MCENAYCQQRRQLLKLAAASSLVGVSAEAAARPVRQLQGQVWVNRRLAHAQTAIRPGDEIITGQRSMLVFTLEKDAYLVRPNSRLLLQQESGVVSALRMLTGGLLSVFAPGRKKILTPVATLGLRGTGVYAEVSRGNTYFCTCYGETEISAWNSDRPAEIISSNYHKARMISASNPNNWNMQAAEFKSHTDAELIMLEALQNRKPDFLRS